HVTSGIWKEEKAKSSAASPVTATCPKTSTMRRFPGRSFSGSNRAHAQGGFDHSLEKKQHVPGARPPTHAHCGSAAAERAVEGFVKTKNRGWIGRSSEFRMDRHGHSVFESAQGSGLGPIL